MLLSFNLVRASVKIIASDPAVDQRTLIDERRRNENMSIFVVPKESYYIGSCINFFCCIK